MGIIIDIIALALVVLFAVLSAKHGFVRSLTETVGFVAAVVIAFSLNTPLADATYDTFVGPTIVSAAEKTMDEGKNNLADAVWGALPKVITRNGEALGITRENVDGSVNGAFSDAAAAARHTSENIVKPVAVKLMGGVYAIIIFIVLIFAVKILSRVLNKLFSFSFIGSFNRTLGAVLGVVKGFVIASVCCAVLCTVIYATGGFSVFTPKAAQASYFCRFINTFFNIL